jgi:peptide/nickel transport system substrate-binding protein
VAYRSRRIAGILALLVAIVALFFILRGPSTQPGLTSQTGDAVARRGGQLVAAIRQDPPTFNRYYGSRVDQTVEILTHLLHAKLFRINRLSGDLEPWLAEEARQDDTVTYTIRLREGVKFSDGVPFTSADVVFSFEAVYDPRTNSAIKQAMENPPGQPIEVAALDARTVRLRFAVPFGPGLRILDNLPVYPKHKLEAAVRAGTMKDAWTPATPPADIVGLGPFRLKSYQPGERVVLERNPHYWRRDDHGNALPYLDALTLVVVRDQNTAALRLEQGQIDIPLDEIRPEDYTRMKELEAQGRVQLADAGVGLDPNMLWFDLRPQAYANDPRKPWLQSEDFRRAISHAVDRQALVDTVFLGAGVPVYGPVTPGNRAWYVDNLPKYEFDRGRARDLLRGLELEDRNGDGTIEDRAGRAVRFSMLAQQGHTVRSRSASVIQDQLRQVGIAVDVVLVDPGSIIQRWAQMDYDAIYHGVQASSYDPANNMDFWISAGGFHLWNPEQPEPATGWEARIDELMRKQVTITDEAARKALFAEAQRIFAEHVPILYFAAPRSIIALSPAVANATPVPLQPPVLWNADTLAVR